MKKALLLGLATFLLATSAFADKIGLVDSQRAVSNFSETKKAQQSIEAQVKKLENEARQKEVLLEKELVTLQAKGDKLTDAEKKAFEKKTQDYQVFLNTSQEKLSKDQFDKLSKIDAVLTKAIDKVAKEGKFDLVVEKDAVRFGGEDITDSVIKAMETLK